MERSCQRRKRLADENACVDRVFERIRTSSRADSERRWKPKREMVESIEVGGFRNGRLLVRELPAQALPCAVDAASYSVLL